MAEDKIISVNAKPKELRIVVAREIDYGDDSKETETEVFLATSDGSELTVYERRCHDDNVVFKGSIWKLPQILQVVDQAKNEMFTKEELEF